MSAPRLGFVGVGNMGSHMARNLGKAGHRLAILDADRARAEAFAASVAGEAAADGRALGGACDIVVTMLPDGHVVRRVILGEVPGGNGDGVAATLAPGSLVIDMSSSDPAGTQALAAELARQGITLIDAPVSGGVTGAEAGTLTIMIGGNDEAAIERARPLLEAMGKRLFRTGPAGSGHAMKALNNYLAATNMAAAAEALIIGARFGLDPAAMIDIINVSTGRNFATETGMKTGPLAGNYKSGFALGLITKDVGIAADLVGHLGVAAPLCQLVRQLYGEALAEEGPGEGHTAAVRHWARRNGVDLAAKPGG